jgi:serine/threonine-protein kinase
MEIRHIGRYEVRQEIGRGGMATVYLAHDPAMNRAVAIKVLPQQYLSNPTLRARFEREARAIAAIEHPAIVPVYDFGDQDGQLYLVMRYMGGGSLAERISKSGLPLDQATGILERLAPALDEVHKRGMVHRDLKPGNILFDRYDNAFLSDFGIAHLTEATTTLTGEALIGTPAYMSPEQVRADVELDGRSDIYALGVIVYEMLCGKQPFRATTPMGLALKHLSEPVPRILTERPDLPEGVNQVIGKAMSKEREGRYASAGEVAEALRRAADQAAVPPASIQKAEAPTVLEELPRSLAGEAPSGRAAQPEAAASRAARPLRPAYTPSNERARPAAEQPPSGMLPRQASSRRPVVWVVGGLAGLVGLCLLAAVLYFGGRMAFKGVVAQPSPIPPDSEMAIQTTEPQPYVSPATQEPQKLTNPGITSQAPDEQVTPAPLVDIFEDDFSDPASGWPSGGDAGGRYGYEFGSYRMYVNQVDTLFWVTPDLTADDVVIEVDATKVSGPDDNYFGFLCRLQDKERYYYLVISSDGFYTIGKYMGGEYVSLLADGWGYSEYIHLGETTNRVRAECVGDQLKLSANGTLLAEVSDREIGTGEFGLMAASVDVAGADILFDNFVARASPEPGGLNQLAQQKSKLSRAGPINRNASRSR